jgi:phosphate transport system protein
MGPHMLHELDKLKQMILALASLVEESLGMSIEAVRRRDAALALRVIEGDHAIDRMEVDAEEECLKILALYQPVANDLRHIISLLKINHDLERIGDLSVTIAERAHALSSLPPPDRQFDVEGMAERSRTMVARSLDALVNRDLALAKEVWLSDDDIDGRNRAMYAEVIDEMRGRPDLLETYLSVISIFRALERIADHATNIAKDVIYIVEGKIVRHRAREVRAQDGQG